MPPDRHLPSRRATTEPSLAPPRPDGDGVEFTVTPAARATRRRLGPVAWAVLEEVLTDATTGASGQLTARTSVRRVAAALGVSKDTAAHALARLLECGLVVRHVGTRADDGTFTTGVYEVLVDRVHGLEPDTGRHRKPPTVVEGVSRRRRVERRHQAALFDLDEATP